MASRSSHVDLADMLRAAVNVAAPALFVLGLGALLYALVPRLAVPVLYGVVLWSFVLEMVGSSVTTNHWLLGHRGVVPPWPGAGHRPARHRDRVAERLGLLAALGGLAAVERRDPSAA